MLLEWLLGVLFGATITTWVLALALLHDVCTRGR